MKSYEPAKDRLLADVFRWDVANWSRHVGIWEGAIQKVKGGYPVTTSKRPLGLEIGADWGGGLALWMALHGIDVVASHYDPKGWAGSDTSYLDEATRVLAGYGVAERVRFQQLDIFHMSDADAYDVIMIKSVLGGLGDVERQQRAVERLHAALRPGGVLLFAENVRGTPLHAAFRALKRGRSWYYPRLQETRAIFSPFRDVTYRTTGVLAAFGLREAQRRWLGRADGVLSRFTPPNWHYVCIGYATK